MKKFLSVLLALAVAFTFTFGSTMSAFATLGNPSTANLETATKYFDDAVSAALSNAKVNPAYANFSSASIEYASTQVKNAETIIIAELIDKYDIDTTGGMSDYKGEVLKWTQNSTTAPTYIGADNLAAYKTTFAAYFEEQVAIVDYDEQIKAAVAQLAAIDTDVYSTSKKTVGSIDYTYKTYAEKLIKDATDTLNAYQNTDSSATETYVAWGSNGAELKAAIDTLLYGKSNGSATDFNKSGTNLYYDLSQLLTVAQEEELNSGATVDKNYAKSDLAYNYKTTKYTDIKAAADMSAATIVGKLGTVGAGDDIVDGTTKIGGVVVYDTANKIVMGVSIADMSKVTAAEASAINTAITKMLNDTLEVTDVYFDELEVIALGSTGTVATDLAALKSARLINVIKKADAARTAYATKEATATSMKGMYTYSGVKMYDNADVDAALAKDKADIYAGYIAELLGQTSFVPKNYLGQVVAINDPTAKAIADAKDKFAITIVTTGTNKTPDADKVYCANYYDKIYYAAWADIATETIEALDNAADVEEVNSIMADAAAKLAKLRTAETAQAIANAKWSAATYQANLNTYATNLVKNTAVKQETYNAIVGKYVGNATSVPTVTITWAAAAEKKCYNETDYEAAATAMEAAGLMDLANTEDELKALYNEAIAALANPITKAELEAKAKEVSDAIAALPSAATVANEAAYMAAYDAYKAYLDLDGAVPTDVVGYLVFLSKMGTLKTAQQNATRDAIAALPATVTTADKDAIEAARAMADKYTDYYDQYDEAFTVSNENTLKNKEDALDTAQKNAVIAAINGLTNESTAEEIKAAREAYDALTPAQKRAIGSAYEYKLAQLEALIAPAYDDQDAKADLLDMSRKLTIWRTSKTSIKVTAVGSVKNIKDNGYTVKYSFYKKAPGATSYKLIKTTTSNKYTYTNLKKGTNKFQVKVKVYDADGKLVATKMTYYRAAKIK